MSGGIACRDPVHWQAWRVTARKGNVSAFNGYRWSPSEWSEVRCPHPHGLAGSPRRWRTKASYVNELPDA